MDGAYDQARQGGTQQGGFGYVAITNGDGDLDTEATEITRAWGAVQCASGSPAYIGATEHTNNTAELTAMAESIRWLLYTDTNNRAPVLLRPDSEYAHGAIMVTSPRNAMANLYEIYKACTNNF